MRTNIYLREVLEYKENKRRLLEIAIKKFIMNSNLNIDVTSALEKRPSL